MNFSNKKTANERFAVILVYVLTLGASIAFTVFNRLFMDAGDSYIYTSDAPDFVLPLFALLAVIVSLYGAFFVRRQSKLDLCCEGGRIVFSAAAIVMALECIAILAFYLLHGPYDIEFLIGNMSFYDGLEEKMRTAMLFYRITVFIAPFASLYFVFSAFKKKISTLFGCVTLVWILSYILRLYFDVTDWVMSPRKLSMICAMAVAALFILYELRFPFGYGNSRKYFFFTSLAAIFCTSCGFTGVVSVIFGVYPIYYEFAYYGVCLMLGVFALLKLYCFAFSCANDSDDEEESEELSDELSNDEEISES